MSHTRCRRTTARRRHSNAAAAAAQCVCQCESSTINSCSALSAERVIHARQMDRRIMTADEPSLCICRNHVLAWSTPHPQSAAGGVSLIDGMNWEAADCVPGQNDMTTKSTYLVGRYMPWVPHLDQVNRVDEAERLGELCQTQMISSQVHSHG